MAIREYQKGVLRALDCQKIVLAWLSTMLTFELPTTWAVLDYRSDEV
jgi:hypothetical protein